MALFGQDRPYNFAGAAALGDMLGGGLQRVEDAAYADALGNIRADQERTSRININREKEAAARNQRVALEGLGSAMQQIGYPEFTQFAQASGGGNPAQLLDMLLKAQEFRALGKSSEAALGGDLDAANAYRWGTKHGPASITKSANGMLFNQVVSPSLDQAVVTPLGQAEIAKDNAAARLSGVRADAGGFSPRSGAKTVDAGFDTWFMKQEIERINKEAEVAKNTALANGRSVDEIERTRKQAIQSILSPTPEAQLGDQTVQEAPSVSIQPSNVPAINESLGEITQTKVLNGKTYVKIGPNWYEQ